MRMDTYYAPAGRDGLNDLLSQKASIEKINNIKDLLSSLSYIVFILNEKRQIVFANQLMLTKLGVRDDMLIAGKRPGEALACIHTKEGPNGCGTSEFCRYCGAVNVILDVVNDKLPSTREAKITVKKGGVLEEQLDLEVSASPLQHENTNYIVFSALDITDRKRKQLLERTFFHDIINLAGSLDGIVDTLDEMDGEEQAKFIAIAKRLSSDLIDEIMAQQQLVRAEANELSVRRQQYELKTIIINAADRIMHHHVGKNKHISLPAIDENIIINTDKTLLNRIFLNMLKNAVEAVPEGDTVTVAYEINNNKLTLKVQNNGVIPRNIQLQMFQRSFSTKGSGRGIGTYSMKLLTERYLKGTIGFRSNEKDQTTFYITIPV
jgi:signal transduction histidine kinase